MFFFMVLGIEPRALHMLDKCFYHWGTFPAFNCLKFDTDKKPSFKDQEQDKNTNLQQ
jgi:hypothetical protein